MGKIVFIAAVGIAYIIGSIPFSYLLTKILVKKDLRTVGSGNVGATNAYRVNKKLSLIVLIMDVSKAYLPLMYMTLTQSYTRSDLFLIGLFAVVGHVFPVWLKLKGGKGVAATLGILGALYPLNAVVFVGTFFVMFLLTRYVSMSSMIAIGATLFAIIANEDMVTVSYYCITVSIVLLRHIGNIQRLIRGEEKKL